MRKGQNMFLEGGKKTDDKNNCRPFNIDGEWIASRRDAVKFYLWKKWHLQGDDLEEVLQETMTAALQSFSKYEGRNDAEPGTYLIGIAKNVAQSYFRRRNRHERRRAPFELAECLQVVFKDEAEAEDVAKLLKEKISKLPKKYVQVLELIFYQDYREGEAAERLGIPPNQLYSIKSDALKRLRKLCKKDKRFKFLF
jgi:RNA polymerase sigma factor (sigma-70 family)